MATTFGQSLQSGITRYPDQGFPGLISEAISVSSAIYKLAASTQSVVITIGVIAATTNYTVTIAGTAITVNSAALTATQLGDALVTAIRRSPFASGRFSVVAAAGVLTLTHRNAGANDTVAVAGGAATISNTPAATNINLPLGRIVAQLDSIVDGQLPTLKLPTASGDIILGAGGVYSHSGVWVRNANGDLVRGIAPGSACSIVRRGNIFLACEGAIAAGSSLFFRHTANGALTALGSVAGASGTGLAALPSAVASAASFSIASGETIVAVDINLP